MQGAKKTNKHLLRAFVSVLELLHLEIRGTASGTKLTLFEAAWRRSP